MYRFKLTFVRIEYKNLHNLISQKWGNVCLANVNIGFNVSSTGLTP